MGDFIDHVDQALHNLECAKSFLKNRNTHDWAITAAFYSAVHFAEAGFSTVPEIGHTETATPINMSAHAFREKQIQDRCDYKCWANYRKLRLASQEMRYLKSSSTGISLDYYSPDDVRGFVNQTLDEVRKGIAKQFGVKLT